MTNALLDYACKELFNELSSQPNSRLKKTVTMNEIESAINTLGWTSFSKSSLDDDTSIHSSDLEGSATTNFTDPITPWNTPECYIFSPTQWVPTSEGTRAMGGSTQSNMDLSDLVLPDGVREFLTQFEIMYKEGSRVSERLEALSASEHLPICFPYLIRFVVDRIRVNYRRRERHEDIERLVELLEKIFENRFFKITSVGTFNLVTNCLIMLSTDYNLFSLMGEEAADPCTSGESRFRIRSMASRLLARVLENKVGKYHSIAFIQELVDVYLQRLMRLYMDRLTSAEHASQEMMKSALIGTVILTCNVLEVNKSMLKSQCDMLDKIRSELKTFGGEFRIALNAIDSVLEN